MNPTKSDDDVEDDDDFVLASVRVWVIVFFIQ